MSSIPICLKPYPDELMYSWVMRLAKISGLPFTLFSAAYLHNRTYQVTRSDIPYDMHEILPLYSHQTIFNNAKDFFLDLSTSEYETIFMSKGEQTRYFNARFRPDDPMCFGFSQIKTACLCPECYKEDIQKYGEPFLHRSHHLTGVKTCYKHHCLLMEFDGKKGHACDYDLNDYRTVTDTQSIGLFSLNAFTDYAQSLFIQKLNTDAEELKMLIVDKLRAGEHNISTEKYDELSKDFEEWGHSSLLKEDIRHILRKRFRTIREVRSDVLQTILMFVFPDPVELSQIVQNQSSLLIDRKCLRCGRIYYTTLNAEQDGWSCPYCDIKMPISDRYKYLIEKKYDGTYEVLEDIESTTIRIRHKHIPCGRESERKPHKMLYSTIRCECELRITEKQVREQIEKYAGYELVQFTYTDEPVYVLHKVCGTVFTMNYHHVPCCTFCDPSKLYGSGGDKLSLIIKDLVGDEYSLISYNGCQEKAEIRHNVCGHVHSYLPYNFTKGSRCPFCHQVLRNDQLRDILINASDGKYDIIRFGLDSVFDVVDKETGQIVSIYSSQVKQEVLRPTRSPIFPKINKDGSPNQNASAWDIAFDLYMKYMKEFKEPPKSGTIYQDFDLGLWCQHQRDDYRKGKLTGIRLKKLQESGFIWDPIETEWQRKFECYCHFVKEHGPNIPHDYEYEGTKLGLWVFRQKKDYRSGKISEERKMKLLSVDEKFFERAGRVSLKENRFENKNDLWEENFEKLSSLVRDNIISMENFRCSDRSLSRWCATQRQEYKKGILRADRKEKLISIGFNFDLLR